MKNLPAADLARALARLLESRRLTLGCAESCTGGLLAATLTDVPGASAWFYGAVVSYDNSVKTRLLQVPPEVLSRCGAVSEACARHMACGARACLGVDHALSVTGIAGPGGGTPEKPVGTVWIAHAGSNGAHACCHHFSGSRRDIREATVRACLVALHAALTPDGKIFP